MSVEVSTMLALALGQPLVGRDVSWPAVLQIARKERCAPLAWFRSASAIRGNAPPEVVEAWRGEAMAAVSLADFWQSVLGETLDVLQLAGVDAVVLKGLPLAQRLYGHVAARPCADLDLHIPLGQREVAHDSLVNAGWHWRVGRAPYEAGYQREIHGRTSLLEVHSSLLDDDLVAHLPFSAPGASAVPLGELEVLAHNDDQLPAYLATHLAKHAMPPLLWLVDFHELWAALSGDERARAHRAARAARAHRYLAWAIDRAGDLPMAAGDDAAALRRLGLSRSGRSDGHNAVRVARLAATPLDVARVVAGWLRPVAARPGWRALGALLVRRMRKPFRRVRGTRRKYESTARGNRGPSARARSITLGDQQFSELLAELTKRGARFSVRATGRSMRPSLAPGAQVWLAPYGGQPISVGDVVLARTMHGPFVLHRVTRVADGWIQTQGDANALPDSPVPRAAIAALAEAVSVDGIERRIPAARIVRVRRFARTVARRARRGLLAGHGRTRTGAGVGGETSDR